MSGDHLSNLAPIAVFAHRRPNHLQELLTSLRENDLASESHLTIFVDGPRTLDESHLVEAVHQVASRAGGFASVQVKMAERNRGLSTSITEGVTQILAQHASIIVLEDDLLVSRFFLNFMNDCLEIYANDDSVASIHGYVYPLGNARLPDTFFVRGADCWGWATWRRAWEIYNPDGQVLLSELRQRKELDAFTFARFAPFEEMLKDQNRGWIDSWAIRWYASTFLNHMLTLYPAAPLVVNRGQDGSGRHRKVSNQRQEQLSSQRLQPQRMRIEEDSLARQAFSQWFRMEYPLRKSPMGRALWRIAHNAKLLARKFGPRSW